MPLHRSLIFWCGFVVFAFLVWSWADSMKWITKIRSDFTGPPRQLQLTVGVGSIDLYVGYFDEGLRGDLWQMISERLGPGSGSRYGWGFKSRPRFLLDGDVFARAPHWLLVACFLPPWLGLSVWRARKIARGRKAAAI